MSVLIHPETLTITTSSGDASANTQNIMGICYNMLIKPATETTTYSISITSPSGIEVYERISETGTLSELLVLPVRGVYTVTIEDATADELFTIQLIIKE